MPTRRQVDSASYGQGPEECRIFLFEAALLARKDVEAAVACRRQADDVAEIVVAGIGRIGRIVLPLFLVGQEVTADDGFSAVIGRNSARRRSPVVFSRSRPPPSSAETEQVWLPTSLAGSLRKP